MDVITSTKNQFVKEFKALSDKKFRDKTGLFVVEGVHIFKDMTAGVEIKYVLATEERRLEIENSVACAHSEVYYISQSVMQYAADTVSPYGILAVCKKPDTEFKLPCGNALLLDGVSDPGNLGTIIRTAAAANFKDVYLLDTADLYSPKTVRATLGALFYVSVMQINLQQAEYLLETTNSVALDVNGKNLLKTELCLPVLFVAGNESHGIREELLQKAEKTVSLPMQNNIESLNVAVAAAVAMYQTL